MPPDILVLQPDPMERVGIRAALASAGYAVVAVASPAEAVEALPRHQFRLILLGPGMDREAAARALRQAEGAPPIVALAHLPDCVVGQAAPGSTGQLPRDLPTILEALTRYLRFAPQRAAGGDTLLADWAEYEGGDR